MKKVELLAPVGNMEKFKMAIHYGADAVFLGGKMFNLRAGSSNFSDEELEEAVTYAHDLGKKVYVTLNIIPHNDELDLLPDYVKFLEKIGIDGVIVADLGVFQIVKENTNLRISVSTQASNTNWRSVQMWRDLGAKRVVLAREISLDNIAEIRAKVPDIELEVFIHGAMCMSISGRCLLSNYMTGRDANRGDCAQSCRWKYSLVEETRPGEYMPVFEDDHGTYIFNSKDLCTIEFIDKILDIGVDSLKIEGRMKTPFYVGTVVKAYRQAIDDCLKDRALYESKKEYYLEEVSKASHREYTTGFYYRKPDGNEQVYTNNSYIRDYDFIGMVEEDYDESTGCAVVMQRNKFEVGDEIEVMPAKGESWKMTVTKMWNEDGEEVMSAPHPQQLLKVKFDKPVKKHDMLRKAVK